MSDFISTGVANTLEYGIDLKLESAEEESFYISRMCDYFNDKTDFQAYLSGEASFDIELDRSSPIMEVIIKESILYMVPYSEDIFEVFTIILGFIAKKHLEVLSNFRGLEIHKIESVDQVNLSGLEEQKKDDEDDNDDDYEWI